MYARFCRILPLVAAIAAPSLAKAECAEAHLARGAYQRGERALQNRDIDLAVKSFVEANQHCPNPQTRLAVANAYLLGKQTKAAAAALSQYIAEADTAIDWCSVLETRRQIAAIDSTRSYELQINVRPVAARLYVRESAAQQPAPTAPGCSIDTDDGRASITLPEGQYALTGQLAPNESTVVIVDPAKSSSVELVIPARPIAAPARGVAIPTKTAPLDPVATSFDTRAPATPRWYDRPESWIWIGSGLVGVASIATGAWALSLQSDLDQQCPQRKCPEGAAWSLVDKHDRLAMVSTIGFVTAGVGALTGAGTYFVLRRSNEPKAQAVLRANVGPAHVTLDWRF